MKKGKIEKVQGGFSVQPTIEYTEKQEREKRMKERKNKPKTNPTNKEVMEMLQDIADRQSEIYDLLKSQ